MHHRSDSRYLVFGSWQLAFEFQITEENVILYDLLVVVWGSQRINIFSLHKVYLQSWHDIFLLDVYELISIRAILLMPKSQSMQRLMLNCTSIDATIGEIQCLASLLISHGRSTNIGCTDIIRMMANI